MRFLPWSWITNALSTLLQQLFEKTSVGTEDISEGYDRVVAGTGIVYVFYDDCGKLSLRKASNLEKKYIIGDESAAISYSYKTSIDEDVYNYIKLVRPNSETGQGDVYAVSAKTSYRSGAFCSTTKRLMRITSLLKSNNLQKT